jgi:hypothetical protein
MILTEVWLIWTVVGWAWTKVGVRNGPKATRTNKGIKGWLFIRVIFVGLFWGIIFVPSFLLCRLYRTCHSRLWAGPSPWGVTLPRESHCIMNRTIAKFIGKQVTVRLCATFEPPLKGELVECDDSCLVVADREKGEIVIPLTSVSYVFAVPPPTQKDRVP